MNTTKFFFRNKSKSNLEEFHFSIKIKDREFRTKKSIKKNLAEYLMYDGEGYFMEENDKYLSENEPYDFLKALFNRNFKHKRDIRAYFTNYHEREGSLIVTFTVVVFYGVSNYGSIRESIDYFVRDLERAFNPEMRNGMSGKVKVSKERQEDIELDNSDNRLDNLNNYARLNRMLIGTVFLLILLLGYHVMSNNKEEALAQSEIELMIIREIQSTHNDQKSSEVKLVVLTSDSTMVVK